MQTSMRKTEKVSKSKTQSNSNSSVQVLNTVLADEYLLFTKTLNYHWNISGSNFYSMHQFLETQYRELLDMMDEVAERVRILDDTPLSTTMEMRFVSGIQETPGALPRTQAMIQDLIDGHKAIVENIKSSLSEYSDNFERDPGTEDLLVNTLQKHEKTIWMLKSNIMGGQHDKRIN